MLKEALHRIIAWWCMLGDWTQHPHGGARCEMVLVVGHMCGRSVRRNVRLGFVSVVLLRDTMLRRDRR
jgi:hypothetical protein